MTPPDLSSFGEGVAAVVFGASGGIGGAFTAALHAAPTVKTVTAVARNPAAISAPHHTALACDLTEDDQVAAAADAIAGDGPVHLVIVAVGILHAPDGLGPEKSWRDLSADALERVYRTNTIGPALAAKHMLPLLDKDRKTAFAALSARVGSIRDNRLGGWHAYRASKAALNMLIKSLSVELARKRPEAVIAGLHPGTVDTRLSEPFQRGVPEGKLFSPAYSSGAMLEVLNGLTPDQSGRVFAYDGTEIPA